MAKTTLLDWLTGPAPALPYTLDDPALAGLVCVDAVRSVRGQRLVCTGVWRDCEVFVKFFFHRWRRRRHWRREDRGVRALLARGVDTPALLLSQALAGGRVYAIVTERIRPAQTALDAWRDSPGKASRGALLARLAETVARHHTRGLVQTDMHLKNFLLSGERLYSLDGAGFKIRRQALSRAAGLDNLGLLFAQFEPAADALTEPAFAAYCALRGGDPQRDLADLKRAIAKNRAYRTRKYLEKVFRDCTAFASRRDFRRYYVYDRDYDSPDLRRLVADPEGFIEANRSKSQNPDGTWRLVADQRRLIVEYFQRPAAAARVWKETHRRRLDNLPAPRPVALVEKRFGPFPSEAYLVTEQEEIPLNPPFSKGDL